MPPMTLDELRRLSEDPDERFVQIEATVRARCESEMRDPEGTSLEALRAYVSEVHAAAEVCGIADVSSCALPAIGCRVEQSYLDFMEEVGRCTARLRMRIGLKREFSVALDEATKTKLRHLISSIKTAVHDAAATTERKEALYACIQRLEDEIERERTRMAIIGDAFFRVCAGLSEGAKLLEPTVRLIERIGAALGTAIVRADDQQRLPPPATRKRIEPPKSSRTSKKGTTASDFGYLDEDIPF